MANEVKNPVENEHDDIRELVTLVKPLKKEDISVLIMGANLLRVRDNMEQRANENKEIVI